MFLLPALAGWPLVLADRSTRRPRRGQRNSARPEIQRATDEASGPPGKNVFEMQCPAPVLPFYGPFGGLVESKPCSAERNNWDVAVSPHGALQKSTTPRPRTGAASFRPTMSTSEHTPAAAARMIAAITARGLWQLAVMRTQIALPPRKTVEQRHAATPVQTDSFAFRSAGGRSPSPA